MLRSQLLPIAFTAVAASVLGYLINQLPEIPDFPDKDRWIVAAVVLITALVAVVTFWQAQQNESQSADSGLSPKQLLEIRQKFLKRLQGDVRLRLENSLHELIKIDVQMEDQRQQVGKPQMPLIAEDSLKLGFGGFLNRTFQLLKGNAAPTSMQPNQKVIEIFERSNVQGKLLILGEPGSGKTTELLTLAQDLLQRAENDKSHAIPVIFELSTWKEDKPIAQWLAEQLRTIYKIPAVLGQQWLTEQHLLPLLDGLDELGLERQKKCIKAINQCLTETPLPGLVMCCRREEYEQGQMQLEHLNGAVYLQSPTESQIQKYLKALNRSNLWENVRSEPELLHLAHSPLFLTMLVVAYQGRAVRTTQELFDAYIKKQLHDPSHQGTYRLRKEPSASQTLHYLVWLAGKLEATHETEFLIENMQPNWLETSKQRFLYRTLVVLLTGLTFGLPSGLLSGLLNGRSTGSIIGLIFGPLIGLLFGLRNSVKPVEKLKWSSGKFLNAPIIGLIVSLLFSLIVGVIVEWSDYLIIGLLFGLIAVLLTGLFLGLSPAAVEKKDSPNQGIQKSIENALRFILLIGPIIGLSVGLLLALLYVLLIKPSFDLLVILRFELLSLLVVGAFFGLIIGLLLGLFSGLGAAIQHLCLRLVLYFSEYIPWNYARFLDHAAKHRFIQRVGGRYRFMHDLLRKHFAQMPLN